MKHPSVTAALILVLAPAAMSGCALGNSHQAAATGTGRPAPSGTAAVPATAAGGSAAAYCASARTASTALASPMMGNGDGPTGATLRSDIEGALATAPAEIKPDVQVMADIELPILDGKVAQDEIDKQLSDPRIRTAMQHIATWARANCPPVESTP